MRSFTPAALAFAVALGLAGTAAAQQRLPKVVIDEAGVRVGFPNSSDGSGYKTGFWAPVYVQLTAPGPDRVTRFDGTIIVSTTDSDDMDNLYRVPLPPMEPKEQTTVLTYVRPGATGSEIQVTIRGSDGRVLSSQRAGRTGFAAAPPGTFLYVTAGADSTPLRRALRPKQAAAEGAMPGGGDEGGEDEVLTTFSHVTQVADLPTRWFGYDAVDALILETGGNKAFVEQLLADRANRKEALAEWVHRGGRGASGSLTPTQRDTDSRRGRGTVPWIVQPITWSCSSRALTSWWLWPTEMTSRPPRWTHSDSASLRPARSSRNCCTKVGLPPVSRTRTSTGS